MAPSALNYQADASETPHPASPSIGAHDPSHSLQVLISYQSQLSNISLPKKHHETLAEILNVTGNIHNYVCQHAKHRWNIYQVFAKRQYLPTAGEDQEYADLLKQEIQDSSREIRVIEAAVMVKTLGEMDRTLRIAKLTAEEVLGMGKETAGPEVKREVEEQMKVIGEIEKLLWGEYEELYLDLRDMSRQYVGIFRQESSTPLIQDL